MTEEEIVKAKTIGMIIGFKKLCSELYENLTKEDYLLYLRFCDYANRRPLQFDKSF